MHVYVFTCLSSLEYKFWLVEKLVPKLVPGAYKVLNKGCSVLLNSFSCLGYWQVQGEWSQVPLSLLEKRFAFWDRKISALFHSQTSTHCLYENWLLMCSNLLSPAVPSFGSWHWFFSSWCLKNQSDPFCPIALTMCSDTHSVGCRSHCCSCIKRGDPPALPQQLGGSCMQYLCVLHTKWWPFTLSWPKAFSR